MLSKGMPKNVDLGILNMFPWTSAFQNPLVHSDIHVFADGQRSAKSMLHFVLDFVKQ